MMEELQDTSVRIASLLVDIWTWDLLNTK
jgi:hypothetical protein